jgi:hypothetical protein
LSIVEYGRLLDDGVGDILELVSATKNDAWLILPTLFRFLWLDGCGASDAIAYLRSCAR